jgi:hypothetical protein
METKEFVLSLIEGSCNLQDVRKSLLKSVRELSLAYEAAVICRDTDEIKQFLKF